MDVDDEEMPPLVITRRALPEGDRSTDDHERGRPRRRRDEGRSSLPQGDQSRERALPQGNHSKLLKYLNLKIIV